MNCKRRNAACKKPGFSREAVANRLFDPSVVDHAEQEAGLFNARRRGATTVETAIVLMVFLTIIFGMMELSVAIFRYHVVSQAARQAARLAIVHGDLAPPQQTNWWNEPGAGASAPPGNPIRVYGPTKMNVDLAVDDSPTQLLQRYVTGLEPGRTDVKLEWLDGNARVGSRVKATVTTKYSPFVTYLFTSDFTLVGESTMQIAH